MRRRAFLSMMAGALGAAIVPKPAYFFLNGLWEPKYGLSPIDASLGTIAQLERGMEYFWDKYQISPVGPLAFVNPDLAEGLRPEDLNWRD